FPEELIHGPRNGGWLLERFDVACRVARQRLRERIARRRELVRRELKQLVDHPASSCADPPTRKGSSRFPEADRLAAVLRDWRIPEGSCESPLSRRESVRRNRPEGARRRVGAYRGCRRNSSSR